MDKKTQMTCLSFIQQFILMQNLRLAFFQSLNSSLSSDWLGPGGSSLNFWQYLLNCQMEIPTPTFGVLKDQSLSLPSLPHLEPSGVLCAPCPCSSYSMIEGGEGVLAPAIGSLWYSLSHLCLLPSLGRWGRIGDQLEEVRYFNRNLIVLLAINKKYVRGLKSTCVNVCGELEWGGDRVRCRI